MRKLQFKITCLLFIVGSTMLFAQKVHYKGGYYTLVNQKIFHRGHNVFGKLTEGQRDTIYMTAQELYNERGKLKKHYKKRRGTDKYKLPEGYWEKRAQEEAQAKLAANTTNAGSTVAVVEGSVAQKTTSQNQSGQIVASSQQENSNNDEKSSGTVAKPQDASNIREEEPVNKEKTEESREKDITRKEKANLEKEQKAEEKKAEQQLNRKEKDAKRSKEKAQKEIEKAEHKVEKDERSKVEREQQNKENSEKHSKDKLDKQVKEDKHKAEKAKKNAEKKAKKESKDAEKSIRKEEKKLDKKEKEIKKADKELKKKEKQLKAQEKAAAAIVTASTVKSSNENSFGTIYFKINKEKTVVDSIGRIKLYFNIVNNSNDELVLLKPNNTYNSRLDFFASNVDCQEIATTNSSKAELEEIKITEEDYIVVQPNSTTELMMNGDYYGNLECGKDDVVLKIEYNPYQIVEQGIQYNEAQQKEFRKAFEKITRMKIESENIKFELKK